MNAQKKRILLKGKTVLDSLAINDVHIINKNTNIGTITTDDGFFEIPLKSGDTLLFSHLNLADKQVLITDKIIADKNFTIFLNEKIYTLSPLRKVFSTKNQLKVLFFSCKSLFL
jgi:hypothetical protein